MLLFVAICSCGTSKNEQSSTEENQVKKQVNQKTDDGYQIVTAELVKKKFQNKVGSETGQEEWYMRMSVQDYYIKFCESDITSKQLEEALDQQDSLIKSLTLKVDFREGEWDICDINSRAQSRIGRYVVVKEILEK